jgi:hypothetical protein
MMKKNVLWILLVGIACVMPHAVYADATLGWDDIVGGLKLRVQSLQAQVAHQNKATTTHATSTERTDVQVVVAHPSVSCDIPTSICGNGYHDQSTSTCTRTCVPNVPVSGRVLGAATSSSCGDCVVFQRDLRIGARGSDVSTLQRALGVSETGYFGIQTKQALAQWQVSHEIISTDTSDVGAGVLGPRTRFWFAHNANDAPSQTSVVVPPRTSEEPRVVPTNTYTYTLVDSFGNPVSSSASLDSDNAYRTLLQNLAPRPYLEPSVPFSSSYTNLIRGVGISGSRTSSIDNGDQTTIATSTLYSNLPNYTALITTTCARNGSEIIVAGGFQCGVECTPATQSILRCINAQWRYVQATY